MQRSVRSSEIDTLDDADLDLLDFGVTAVDADGVILRYNSYEARLARLDRNQVLGRNFFREIAPCTQCAAFEGRFRQVVATGNRVKFEFLFDFRFGAQEVTVEIVSIPGENRYYLLINRRSVLPARPGLPVSSYAVLQRELAPEETQLGVRRDSHEQRVLAVPWSWLASLRVTCSRLAPETWPLFCNDWGSEWGRRVAQELDTLTLEKHGTPLHEQSMREVARLLTEYFARQGWGFLRLDFAQAREGMIVAEVERSILSEVVPAGLASTASSELACHHLAGCLSSVMSQIAARRLIAREVSCKAGGAPHCTLIIVAEPRRATLDAILGQGVRGLEQVRNLLRSAPAAIKEQ